MSTLWFRSGDEYKIFLYDGSTIIQLTDNNYDDWGHQINAQGHVVWHGFGNEDPDDPTTDSEIFLYDGSTTIQLTDNNGDDYYPQINANGDVVWSGEDTYGNHQIFLYAGGTPTQLTFDTQGDNHGPQINANGDVVYTRKPYPLQIMTRIFLYDHSIGGAPFMLVPSDYGLSPQINAEGHVVWYNDYQYKDIQFYDGSAIIELTLDTTVRDWFPQINSNGDVVWQGYIQGVGGCEIFLAITDPDRDDDGIHNDVDEDPDVTSTRFSDIPLGGTTSGHILGLDAGITIEIMDAPNPDGVKVLVSGPDENVARIKIDGSKGIYKLAPGEHILTSGSVRLDVLVGSAEVEFIIGGATVVVGVEEGGTVILEETIVDGELQELVVNAIQGVVTVNGEVLPPGESVTIMSVSIDIKPGSDPNCFNNNGHGVIPVAIMSSVDFDANQVDPTTVTLDGQDVRVVGKGNMQAHSEDVNGDGLDDLVVQIEDEDGTYQEGDTVATLTGETFDDKSIMGTDTICIVP